MIAHYQNNLNNHSGVLLQIRTQDESGSFFIWMAVSILLVLSTVGYLYFNNARLAAYTQLQSIAEAAAIAGTQQLCPEDACLENAYKAALTTIGHNFSLHNKGYHQISLKVLPPVNPQSKTNRTSYISEDNDLEVVIYHGWISREKPETDKQYFEEVNLLWQEENPGIPAQLVINSLVVEMTLKGISSIVGFEVGNSNSALIKAKAIARSGPINNVPIAPFAIPACALLNEEGSFNPADICYGDRLFTRSDRYLPAVKNFLPFSVSYEEALEGVGPFIKPKNGVANDYLSYYGYKDRADAEQKRSEAFKKNLFGVRPSFFYGPCSKDINECNIKRELNYSLDPDNSSYSNEYKTFGGWSNYAYSHISDHYGVVGSTKINVTSESQLAMDLIYFNQTEAVIGQEFNIFHQGLTHKISGDAIWDIMTQKQAKTSYFFGKLDFLQNEITMSSNRTLGLASLANFPNLELLPDRPLPYTRLPVNILPPINLATNLFTKPAKIFFNEARLENNDPTKIDQISYPTLLRDQFSNGLCQSRRMKLDCNGTDLLTASNVAGCLTDLNEQKKHFEPSEYTPNKQDEFKDYTGQSFTVTPKPKNPDKLNNIWQTKIPIIAEVGQYASPCIGRNKSKPSINIDAPYQIIGFVDIDIFDLDIGPANPTPPVAPALQLHSYTYTTPSSAVSTTANPDLDFPNFHDYHLKYQSLASDIKMPEIEETVAGPNPWLFQIDDPLQVEQSNTPRECNLVRARVACNNNFIASSQNYGPRRAELISAKLLPVAVPKY